MTKKDVTTNSFDRRRVTRDESDRPTLALPCRFWSSFLISETHILLAAVRATGGRKSLFSFISPARRGSGDALQRLAVFRGGGGTFCTATHIRSCFHGVFIV